MKYVEEYLNDVIKVKPLGELTTKDDELNGMSCEMVYIDGKCSGIFISHADYANWLEKRGEQKPASITDEWIEDYWQHKKVNNPYSYDKGEEIQFDHQGFVRFCKKYCKNPAEWTKEDEKYLSIVIAEFSKCAGKSVSKDEWMRCNDFLHSLRDKRFSQPKQQQYEDITDEELLQARKEAYNDALNKIEYHSDTPTFIDGWSAAIWYLKKRNAMPSQRRWKPSDEQIEALKWQLDHPDLCKWRKRDLESLYNDLKKLKEE